MKGVWATVILKISQAIPSFNEKGTGGLKEQCKERSGVTKQLENNGSLRPL